MLNMDTETVVGIVIVVLALITVVVLVAWSRWAINRIADRDLKSVRDIIKDFENGS